jgi:hypothetical protein
VSKSASNSAFAEPPPKDRFLRKAVLRKGQGVCRLPAGTSQRDWVLPSRGKKEEFFPGWVFVGGAGRMGEPVAYFFKYAACRARSAGPRRSLAARDWCQYG